MSSFSGSPLEVLILDFDGVILDSVQAKTRAFAELFRGFGSEVVQKVIKFHEENGGISRFEKFRHFFKEFIGQPLSETRLEELGEEFRRLALGEVLSSDWIPGAPEFLEKASCRWPLYVASGTPENELREIVQARGLSLRFRGVFGSPARKEEIIGRVLNAEGARPSDALFIGDALTDYRAAAQTGVRFIGVTGDRISPFPKHTLTVPDLHVLTGLLD